MMPALISEIRKLTEEAYTNMRVSDAVVARINANIRAAAEEGKRTARVNVREDEVEAIRKRFEHEGYAVGRMPVGLFPARVYLSFRW